MFYIKLFENMRNSGEQVTLLFYAYNRQYISMWLYNIFIDGVLL